MASAATESIREFAMTDRDFGELREVVHKQTGIYLSDAKRDLVYSRLSRRLRHLNLSDFRTYCEYLRQSEPELICLTNAITTNLTSFFREPHHFEFLAELLPKLANEKKKLRVWSAGCSTGEEPYSIAMVIRETLPELSRLDIKILATDLDSDVLAHAAAGVYAFERVASLSSWRLGRWFHKGRETQAGNVKVRPELSTLVRFRQLNLIGVWPMRSAFDVIFCRNVVIYFDKDTQRALFDRYADQMTPGGHLFVGHSESLFRVSTRFKLLGKAVYTKTA